MRLGYPPLTNPEAATSLAAGTGAIFYATIQASLTMTLRRALHMLAMYCSKISVIRTMHASASDIGLSLYFLMQLAEGGNVLLDTERDLQGPILEKSKQCILPSRKPCQQVHRLSQHRFTDQ